MQDEADVANRACVTVCRSCRTVPACEDEEEVSWNRLDCQDELHKRMNYNKFATLTPGEEEQEVDEDIRSIGGYCSFALNTAVQGTCAKER